MAKLVFTETVSNQLDTMPHIDGRFVWTTDTKQLYRDTADERIKISSADITVSNSKVTIRQNGQEKGSFTLNKTGDTVIELTDNDTTYTLKSFGVTVTSTDINHTSGLKANAQEQIDDIISGLLTQDEYEILLSELES